MYQLTKHKDEKNGYDYYKISNSTNTSLVKIYPSLGASIQELWLEDRLIIKNLSHLYSTLYTSALLFPFANRIYNGTYTYNNTDYFLEKNEKNINAIHGLVYNKSFTIVEEKLTEDYGKLKLKYSYEQEVHGFPFNFNIEVVYTLEENSLGVQIEIINTGKNSFPFSLGWHPYFFIPKHEESKVILENAKKLNFSETFTLNSFETIHNEISFTTKNYDDCYYFEDKTIKVITPSYAILLTFENSQNYVQIYTPLNQQSIAIEPVTAPANAFNNTIGLKKLYPFKKFKSSWQIKKL